MNEEKMKKALEKAQKLLKEAKDLCKEQKEHIEALTTQSHGLNERDFKLGDMPHERLPVYHVHVTRWGRGCGGSRFMEVFCDDTKSAKIVELALKQVFKDCVVSTSEKKHLHKDDDGEWRGI